MPDVLDYFARFAPDELPIDPDTLATIVQSEWNTQELLIKVADQLIWYYWETTA